MSVPLISSPSGSFKAISTEKISWWEGRKVTIELTTSENIVHEIALPCIEHWHWWNPRHLWTTWEKMEYTQNGENKTIYIKKKYYDVLKQLQSSTADIKTKLPSAFKRAILQNPKLFAHPTILTKASKSLNPLVKNYLEKITLNLDEILDDHSHADTFSQILHKTTTDEDANNILTFFLRELDFSNRELLYASREFTLFLQKIQEKFQNTKNVIQKELDLYATSKKNVPSKTKSAEQWTQSWKNYSKESSKKGTGEKSVKFAEKKTVFTYNKNDVIVKPTPISKEAKPITHILHEKI